LEWAEQGRPRLLIIDNYDSFTYNLVQMMAPLEVALEVVRNDVLSVEQLLSREPDGLVLSPGPGRPENAGVCVDLLRRAPSVPILGVCLGHQAMAFADGATIDRAPVVMHGKTSRVCYEPHAMFEGVPQPFVATRYHSLCVVEETLSDNWLPVAWSNESSGRTLMAIAHKERPYWGFQFHPESILTEPGAQLLTNFIRLVENHQGGGRQSLKVVPEARP